MVCEKRLEVEYDFRKDFIKFILEGDILFIGNRIILGVDDGIGVVMVMVIFEDKNLKYFLVDVIFIIVEEEDMSGVLNINKFWFNINRLINIDYVVDIEIIVGSCGGVGVDLKFFVEYIKKIDNYKGY